MKKQTKTKKVLRQEAFLAKRALGRNNRWYDIWSLVHFCTGVLLGWLMAPFVAIVIMILWEPLEILVLSPILARLDIDFGYETAKNSFSDIVVDTAGVALGYYVVLHFISAPFHLF